MKLKVKERSKKKFQSRNSQKKKQIEQKLRLDLNKRVWDSLRAPKCESSYLLATLAQLTEFDATESFQDFKNDLFPLKLFSYAHVLNAQKSVVQVLNKHLSVPDSNCYASLFKFLISLAHDLQSDGLINVIDWLHLISSIGSKAADDLLLQEACTTIYLLLKLHGKYAVANINSVLKSVTPLLFHNRQNVRLLTCDAISLIFLKSEDILSTFKIILNKTKALQEQETYQEIIPTVSLLMCRAFASTTNAFNSRMIHKLQDTLELCWGDGVFGEQVSVQLTNRVIMHAGLKGAKLIFPIYLDLLSTSPRIGIPLISCWVNWTRLSEALQLNHLYERLIDELKNGCADCEIVLDLACSICLIGQFDVTALAEVVFEKNDISLINKFLLQSVDVFKSVQPTFVKWIANNESMGAIGETALLGFLRMNAETNLCRLELPPAFVSYLQDCITERESVSLEMSSAIVLDISGLRTPSLDTIFESTLDTCLSKLPCPNSEYDRLAFVCVQYFARAETWNGIGLPRVCQIIKAQPCSIYLLNIVPLLTSRLTCEEKCDWLRELQPIIIQNFAHETRAVRLASLEAVENLVDEMHPLAICVTVERNGISMHTYRQALLLLQKIRPHLLQQSILHPVIMHKCCLYYILGLVHVNLSPMWKPLLGLVQLYSQSMGVDDFMDVYLHVLDMVDKQMPSKCEAVTDRLCIEGELEYQNELLCPYERIDLNNVKSLLWQSLSQMQHVLDRRTKVLSPRFIQLANRYMNGKYGEELIDLTQEPISQSEINFSSIRQLLLTALKAFSQLENPKAAALENELRTIYEQLLLSSDDQIQLETLHCLFAYKHGYLKNYKELLESFVDDKKLRDVLAHFQLKDIQNDHVESVMPLICRLLYGRMLGKGRDAERRRQACLQWMQCIHASHLQIFFKLCLQPINHYLQFGLDCDDLIESMENIVKRIETNAFPSIERVLTTCRLLNCILEQLPYRRLVEERGLLLKACLTLTCMVTKAKEDVNLHADYKNAISKLSKIVFKLDSAWLLAFRSTPFSDEEVDLIKVYILAPAYQLGGLRVLRLAETCAKEQNFLPLLKLSVEDGRTILDALMSFMSVSGQNFQDVLTVLHSLSKLDGGVELLIPHTDTIVGHLVEGENNAALLMKNVNNVELVLSLCEFSKNEQNASLMIKILVPMVKMRWIGSSALHIIFQLLKIVNDMDQFITGLCPLLSELHEREARTCLMQCWLKLSTQLPQLERVLKWTVQLNSYSSGRVEEANFEVRLKTFKEIEESFEKNEEFLRQPHALNIILRSLFFAVIKDDEASLRPSGTHAIQCVIRWAKTYSDQGWTENLVQKMFIKNIKLGFKNKNESIRHECVNILCCLVDNFGRMPRLAPLVPLRTPDECETDFFENICHIQIHRRTRIIHRMCNAIQTGEIRDCVGLGQILRPLLLHFFDESYAKHSGLTESVIRFIGTIAGQLGWSAYYRLLINYLNRMEKTDQKIQIKLLVAVLNSFKPEFLRTKDDATEESEDKVVKEITTEAVEVSSTPLELIEVKILPLILKNLTPPRGTNVEREDFLRDRAATTLATLKLLSQLPDRIKEENLPQVLLKLLILLKSRSTDVRQVARKMMAQAVQFLGPKFLSFILNEMKGLLKRGYQVHVLIYSMHSLLAVVEDELKMEHIQPCADAIIELCLEDVFGEASKEKSVQKISSKLLEARTSRTGFTLKLVGRLLPPHKIKPLLDSVKDRLSFEQRESTLKKARDALNQVSQGLVVNEALTMKHILLLVHNVMQENLQQTNKGKPRTNDPTEDTLTYLLALGQSKCKETSSVFLLQPEPGREAVARESGDQCSELLLEWAIDLLDRIIRHATSLKDTVVDTQLINPFVQPLLDTINSHRESLVTSSVRCMCRLLPFDLADVISNQQSLLDRVFVLLARQQSQERIRQLPSLLLKILSLIVRQEKIILSTRQMDVLLEHTHMNLHGAAGVLGALGLLKSIIIRNVQSERLQQIVMFCTEMAVVHSNSNITAMCRQVVSSYLSKDIYTSGHNRVVLKVVALLQVEATSEKHPELMLVSHVVPSIKMILLEECYSMLFTQLSLSLANELSEHVKCSIREVILILCRRLHQSQQEKLLSIAVNWLAAKDLSQQNLGLSLLPVFCQLNPSIFQECIENLVQFIRGVLEDSIIKPTLICIKLMIIEKSGQIEQDHLRVIWDFVLSPFEKLDGLEYIRAEVMHLLMGDSHRVAEVDIFETTSNQLRLPNLDKDLAQMAIKNHLCWLKKACYPLNETEIARCVKLLHSIVKFELNKFSNSFIKRTCAFKWVAGFCQMLSADQIVKFVVPNFLSDILRESQNENESHIEIRTLCMEVADLIKAKIGQHDYAQLMAQTIATTATKRLQRRQQKAQLALIDPEKSAAKKIRKHKMKIESKRKKILEGAPFKKRKVAVLADGEHFRHMES